MIKFFPKNLRTERLVLKQLEPNMQNAKMIYNALKNERPSDYKYEPLVQKNIVPKSVNETLRLMKQYANWATPHGCVFYMFYKNQFIGVRRLLFFQEASTIKFATVWIVSAARRKGFAEESFRLLEDIAFNKLKVNRLSRGNIKDNKASAKLAEKTGFILDGIGRQTVILDGHFYDLMMWSKLHTDYLKERKRKH